MWMHQVHMNREIALSLPEKVISRYNSKIKKYSNSTMASLSTILQLRFYFSHLNYIKFIWHSNELCRTYPMWTVIHQKQLQQCAHGHRQYRSTWGSSHSPIWIVWEGGSWGSSSGTPCPFGQSGHCGYNPICKLRSLLAHQQHADYWAHHLHPWPWLIMMNKRQARQQTSRAVQPLNQ